MDNKQPEQLTHQDAQVMIAYMVHMNKQLNLTMNASNLASVAAAGSLDKESAKRVREQAQALGVEFERNDGRLAAILQNILDPEIRAQNEAVRKAAAGETDKKK